MSSTYTPSMMPISDQNLAGSDVRRGSAETPPNVDRGQFAKDYARAKPEVAAMWCFGIGFVLGWKLKPW